MSVKCNCMICRRKEFKKSFALYIYSEITNNVYLCENLVENGIKEDSLENNNIGSYLSCLRFNTDEMICMLLNIEDKENKKYINYLKKHNLYDELISTIDKFNKLWNKK